jgi:hypothetical protein
MAKIYSQLEKAQLENRGSDPSAGTTGLVYINTATGKVMVDDGSSVRPVLRNDGKAIIGSDASAANNVRLHRSEAETLQFVKANDSTAEGSKSTSLAKLSMRLENVTEATKPTAGNSGRVVWVTDSGGSLQFDTGAQWKSVPADALALSGGTMTGEIILAGTPSNSLGAVPKSYLESYVASYVDPKVVYEDPIEFSVFGTLNGVTQSEALVYRVPRNLTVTAVKAMVKTAGSAGNLVVDIKKKTGAGSFTSILSSAISVAYTAGNYAVGTGTVTTTSLSTGDILSLDITSVQTNMVDFAVYVEVTRA